MKFGIRHLLLIVLIALSVLSIYSAVSPKGSDAPFSFQNKAACDFSISLARMTASAQNFSHVKGFFFLSLLALLRFRGRQIFGAFLFVLFLTLATEALQMWSPSRHCRLTDALPNFMGLIAAIAVMWIFSRFKRATEARQNF